MLYVSHFYLSESKFIDFFGEARSLKNIEENFVEV